METNYETELKEQKIVIQQLEIKKKEEIDTTNYQYIK
ncbi:MAG: hypothetical protein ACI959_002085 [Limisphaerales bacterium]|jgi:hypothetical protein